MPALGFAHIGFITHPGKCISRCATRHRSIFGHPCANGVGLIWAWSGRTWWHACTFKDSVDSNSPDVKCSRFSIGTWDMEGDFFAGAPNPCIKASCPRSFSWISSTYDVQLIRGWLLASSRRVERELPRVDRGLGLQVLQSFPHAQKQPYPSPLLSFVP